MSYLNISEKLWKLILKLFRGPQGFYGPHFKNVCSRVYSINYKKHDIKLFRKVYTETETISFEYFDFPDWVLQKYSI